MLLKYVFHIIVKDLDYFCVKTLHINFRNNRSLTSPVPAYSQGKLLSKSLQFYLKYSEQNFITNPKSSRIAAVVSGYCSYKTGFNALTKPLTFKDTLITSFPAKHQNWYTHTHTQKKKIICCKEKCEWWLLLRSTCYNWNCKVESIFFYFCGH